MLRRLWASVLARWGRDCGFVVVARQGTGAAEEERVELDACRLDTIRTNARQIILRLAESAEDIAPVTTVVTMALVAGCKDIAVVSKSIGLASAEAELLRKRPESRATARSRPQTVLKEGMGIQSTKAGVVGGWQIVTSRRWAERGAETLIIEVQ